MEEATEFKIPVHVKTRIGVDDFDSYEFFYSFIKTVTENCKTKEFYIHSRKAFL
jgi:tRNA-dihydrouridine synthase A